MIIVIWHYFFPTSIKMYEKQGKPFAIRISMQPNESKLE